ncbi:MAG: small multi-drug export protein [Clostridia bacterium]|nr:small multi-drug export protein [Clostridia bacterium]
MTQFICNLIGNNFWATIIMSFIPLIELKGGITFARSVNYSFLEAFLIAYLGSTIVFVLVFFLLRPILNLLKKIKWFNGFALKVENYFSSKANDTLSDRQGKSKGKLSEKALKQLGVFIFVAIPLPMTGVWTGTAVAVFLNLDFKDVILPVVLGNAVAGLIISLLAELCTVIGINLDYILYGLFALAVILLAITIIKVSKEKTEEKKEE